ncbi:MAG: alpha/beta fold hydrolase [Bacillota bacterium]|nr:alpha/beta fold hydrolase [Bacillota bacterium]
MTAPEPRLQTRFEQVTETKTRSRGRRIIFVLIVVLSLLILVLGGISTYVGWGLTHPQRKLVKGDPGQLGLSYQTINFPSRFDKLKLSGWYLPAPQAKAIIIEAHGYNGNRCNDKPELPVAKALVEKGFSVLMFDFRDSGSSEGSLVSVGDFEQRDLLGAVDYAKELGYQKIGVIGYSMGAATSAIVAAQENDIQAIILDSPFADLKKYLEVNMPHWTGLPNFPFTPIIIEEIPLLTGINPERVSPIKAMESLTQKPILFIAGDADTTIPLENSKQLLEAVNNPKDELWIVHGAVHVGAYPVQPEQYLQKVTRFFNQSLVEVKVN